jgi:hypothetical protein
VGSVHQFRTVQNITKEPLDVLSKLINQAEERSGCLNPDEVLKLTVAATEAVKLLLSDLKQICTEALQDAVFETFLDKENT